MRECERTGAAELDGLKTMASWLRGHGHLTPAEAARVVRSGRALEHLPATAAAFAEGAITAGQVAVIAPIASEEARAAAAAQGVDLGAIEQSLVAVAAGDAHAQLRPGGAGLPGGARPGRRRAGPDRGPAAVNRPACRRLAARCAVELDAIGGEKVEAAIESIVQASRPAG